jgi:hypothetical protein
MDEIKAGVDRPTDEERVEFETAEADQETEIVGRLLLSAVDLSDEDVDRIWEGLPRVEWRFDPEELADKVVKKATATT